MDAEQAYGECSIDNEYAAGVLMEEIQILKGIVSIYYEGLCEFENYIPEDMSTEISNKAGRIIDKAKRFEESKRLEQL